MARPTRGPHGLPRSRNVAEVMALWDAAPRDGNVSQPAQPGPPKETFKKRKEMNENDCLRPGKA